MALVPPASLPLFRADGHAFRNDPKFASVKSTRGHPRSRKLWTGVPRTYDVAWRLTEAQMAAMDAWFEGPLARGERHFYPTVLTEDGLRFWESAFAGIYQAEPFNGEAALLWDVTFQIVTFGDALDSVPHVSALSASYGLALEGSVTVYPAASLSVSYGLALELAPLHLKIGPGFRLKIDADNLLSIA